MSTQRFVFGQLCDLILALLRERGPMTRAEMALLLELEDIRVSKAVSRLMHSHDKMPKRLHIVAWDYFASGMKRYPRPVYAAGNGKDMPRPVSDARQNRLRYLAEKTNRFQLQRITES